MSALDEKEASKKRKVKKEKEKERKKENEIKRKDEQEKDRFLRLSDREKVKKIKQYFICLIDIIIDS